MPLSTDLPTAVVAFDGAHVDGHNATNTRVNEVATEVNAHDADLGTLRTQLFGGSARTTKPLVQLRLAAPTTIPGGNSTQLVAADWTVEKDTDAMWASSVITVPFTGIWRARLFGIWAADATGTRWMMIFLNGTSDATDVKGVHFTNPTVGWETAHAAEVVSPLTAGDVLRLYAFHDSASASIDLLPSLYGPASSTFTFEWVGPA